jgi:hypothetical protein|tara:strand:+ start:10413 stop:11057 length:645 start_codon:yes stop_codon:yes gene_type:complete
MAWTYTTLTQAIKDYTENTETTFVNNIGLFVRNAEQIILRTIQLPDFRKNVTGTLTLGNKYLSMPTDFLFPYSLAIDNSGYEFLIFKDVNFIREAYPVASTTSIPKYYGIFDEGTFIVGPTPNANFTAELHYFYQPESITVSSDGTSWLGTNADNALLFGSLVQAYVFMKGEADILQIYTSQFETALGQLKLEGDGYNRTDAYRTGQTALQTNR